MADKEYTVEERTRLVYEHLKNLLNDEKMTDLREFTMGGISACCVILNIENPYTGHKFLGDLTELF
jgi:hypothetical protein